MIEPVLAVVSNVEILPAVVVVIADADALSPTRSGEAGLCSDIRESSVVIVAIEMISRRWSGRKRFEPGSVHQKNIGPAVIVVIKDRDAGAGGLDDVFLGVDAAEDLLHGEARFFGYVGEVGDRFGWRGSLCVWVLGRNRRDECRQSCRAGKLTGTQAQTAGNLQSHDSVLNVRSALSIGQCR